MSRYSRGKGRSTWRCSFCDSVPADSADLVAGPPGIHICRSCVTACNRILEAERSGRPPGTSRVERGTGVPTPEAIFRHLDEYVVGQDAAKKILAVAVHAHYRRLESLERADPEVELEKSNVLLIGPTGSGKTLLAKTLARFLDVPLAIADATPLTEAGYVGEDVESILAKLLDAAGHDLERAQRGIIYIDEIDKIARTSHNVSITRDVSGEGVQQALLKILEGTVANVPLNGRRKHAEQHYIQVPTEHILFICGGAFSGIQQIIARRIGRKTIGFASQPAGRDPERGESLVDLVEQTDLIQFGMIPELVGRLPVIAPLGPLSFEQVIAAMTRTKNAIVKQFQAYFALDGCELVFTPDALRKIAEIVLKRETGVRALRSILEELLLEERFQLPSRPGTKRLVVTGRMVKERLLDRDGRDDPAPLERRRSA